MVGQYDVFRSFRPYTACMFSICSCTETSNIESSSINGIAITFDTCTIDLVSQLSQVKRCNRRSVQAPHSHTNGKMLLCSKCVTHCKVQSIQWNNTTRPAYTNLAKSGGIRQHTEHKHHQSIVALGAAVRAPGIH